ncbi:hypothetical protein SAMN06295885_2532 [Rathayibacter oskolensis]|uniref:Uncharacterized protein n=1 Tax=Rathayibacter oskolensis TaxID=1891671 RepID=A0A1X7P4V2_9MICO|nr:DUF2188 domain-containing protein [Rathayibacter oskolensis]SMH45395.1 hypothetical protein SAMN06295885_2532 [Rathayibacter oskolensis]
MTTATVAFDAASGGWLVTRDGSSGREGPFRTQALAMSAASAGLAAAGGGTLLVQGRHGPVRLTRTIAPEARVAFTPHDALAAAEAGLGRIAGDQTTDSGDDALEKVLLIGPGAESRRAVSTANRWLDVLVIAAGLIGPALGIRLIDPGLDGGVAAIVLSTLSISGGVFVAFLIIVANGEHFASRSGAVGAALVLAGSLVLSNVLAIGVGQPTTLDQDGGLLANLQRVSRYGMPPDLKLAALAVTVVASVLLGGIAVYGPVGMVLSVACGALVGWRAHDLIS